MKTFAERKWGDCSGAVAYSLYFTKLCYGYPSDTYYDYHKKLCTHCDHNIEQIKDYEYPKIDFSKKDFVKLETYEYAVSEKLKNDMLAFGVSEDCFRPIHNRKHTDVVAYQIAPSRRLSDFSMLNACNAITCSYCGCKKYSYADNADYQDAYKGFGYPLYIDSKTLEELDTIAITNMGDVIISLELFNYLLEKYPKLEAMPVFLGNIKEDREYIRLHDTGEETDKNMTSYSLLEHYSNNGVKELGVFKTDDIPDIVKDYSSRQGFNKIGTVFSAEKSCMINDKLQNRAYILYVWSGDNPPPYDEELEDYDYDVVPYCYHDVFTTRARACKGLADYLAERCLTENDVIYHIGSIPINTKYWYDDFFSI